MEKKYTYRLGKECIIDFSLPYGQYASFPGYSICLIAPTIIEIVIMYISYRNFMSNKYSGRMEFSCRND